MSIKANQLRIHVIVPAISSIGLYSMSAENLLLGTAAQESHLGEYLKQVKGVALGIYQMEPDTYHWLWDSHVKPKVNILSKIRLYCGYSGKPDASRLVSDLTLATIMARLRYSVEKESLPFPNNIEELARYWKKYYNTENGSGTTEEFILNYRKYVYD